MSKFLFNTSKQYLSDEQIAHLNEYLANRPKFGHAYVIGKIHTVPLGDRYPKGAITHETYDEPGRVHDEDGTRYYRTPSATLDSKYSLVWVNHIDLVKNTIERTTVSSVDWLKLARKAETVLTPEEAEPLYAQAKLNEKIARARSSKDPFAIAKANIAEVEGIPEPKKVSETELKEMHATGAFPKGEVTFAQDAVKSHLDKVSEVNRGRGNR